METKLDSRQGQFPATFPDTFKDFFAMMSEDEDHLDLFSNLLEDKVIPRANKFSQRRCGGSLRCSTHPNSAGSGSTNVGAGGGAGSGAHNVGRSNSFRVNRPRNTFGSNSGALNSIGRAMPAGCGSVGSVSGGNTGSILCKHIKYCCLHQQQQQQQQQKELPMHKSSSSQLFQLQQQQQHQQHHSHTHHYGQPGYHDYSSSAGTRLGPDGEDNNECSATLLGDAPGSVGVSASNGQHTPLQTQKRHSIILERAFDFDASCEESDTISTTSSTPTATNNPYNILKPILKQPQQHAQNPQQLQTPTAVHAAKVPVKELPHRMLPQPPKGVGLGAYHTKEAALQRIQQQSGLLTGSKTNLNSLCGMLGSTVNLADVGVSGGAGSGATSNTNNNHYSSNSNYQTCGNGLASGAAAPAVGSSGGAAGARAPGGLYMDLHSPTTPLTVNTNQAAFNKFNDFSTAGGTNSSGAANNLSACNRNNFGSIRAQKSPILNRRRSSSIVANLLAADMAYNRGNSIVAAATIATTALDDSGHMRSHHHGGIATGTAATANAATIAGATMPHSSTRDRISLAKSPVSSKPLRIPLIPVESGVLTFQQAMSGAVSPQYSATSPMRHLGGGSSIATGLDMLGSTTALAAVLEGSNSPTGPCVDDSPTCPGADDSPTSHHERGAAGISVGSSVLHGSSATIAQLGNKQRQRMRTSSMPAESRKPRLADTRRAAIHCADIDLDYYRLRSFSITSHGVCNLGDSVRSRRSRSINSVTSTTTTNSGKDRHNSNASRTSGDVIFEQTEKRDAAAKANIPAYKVAMLGASGVGKTTLTYQFTTSEYICAYDLSLDDDYGQKTVSVLVDGIETDLEIIDHPACEMSTEAFCSTYNIDLFVVVYSVVDRSSFKAAEKVLQYLKENDMLLTRGAILVGNKTDLERHREVNRPMARKVAKEIACKFIETSSGLDHNVDELLVGIVAQVKLNPQRLRNLSTRDRQRLNLQNTIQKHRRVQMPQRRIVRQMSMCQADDEVGNGAEADGELHAHGNAELKHCDENHSSNVMLSSIGDEGIGTGSERTASTSLSSGNAIGSKCCAPTNGPIRKSNKRTLNLESILKMGESELEDEEEAQRQAQNQQPQHSRPMTKFELLTASNKSCTRTPFSSVNSSPKSRQSNESSSGSAGRRSERGSSAAAIGHFRDSLTEENQLLEDCNRKTVSKLTSRTKVFLSSVLRFKKAINVKRRSSSSCSDLFVI